MTASESISRYLMSTDLRWKAEWNTFQPSYDSDSGWPLRLPTVDWNQTDIVVVVMQDFVTMRENLCVELERIENHFGSYADKVFVIHWPNRLNRYYHGRLNLVEFNVHEFDILHNLRERDDWQLVWALPRTKQWQCLNGRSCRHRVRAAHVLQSWPHGILTLHHLFELPDWPYSTYKGTSNEDNYVRLQMVYGSCVFNIVTETQYNQVPGIVTEKTFFAMLSQQIPLVIGYRGIVDDCRDLGFDMFDDVLDLSYDSLPDDCRVEQALERNRDVILNYRPDVGVQERLQRQRQWVLEQWPDCSVQRMQKQFESVFKTRGWI